jgi:hypothetical protein
MAAVEAVAPDWAGEACIVAAPGPSLTPDVIEKCRMARWLRGWRILCVQDAYKAFPLADAMYACNPSWWEVHKDCGGFAGEKWSTHEEGPSNDKLALADKYGIRLVAGSGAGDIFSLDPKVIHYGSNSGFQAIGLAILKGCKRIVLVGYDMRHVGGKSHFFGDHPKGLHQNTDDQYRAYQPRFERAARILPKEYSIVNATPGSALTSFPMASLEDAIAGWADSPPVGKT